MNILQIVKSAFLQVGQHRRVLARALAIPVVGYLLVDAVRFFVEPGIGGTLVLSLITLGIHTIFAITTHRVMLLGPDSIDRWGLAQWTRRESTFAVYVIAMGLAMIPLAFLALIPLAGQIVVIPIMCWLVGRWSLVFPGIAVDKGVTFGLSWELTHNYQIQMLMVVAALPIFLSIPAVLASYLPNAFFLSSLLSTFAIVFEVAALSVAYKLITEHACTRGEGQHPENDIEVG